MISWTQSLKIILCLFLNTNLSWASVLNLRKNNEETVTSVKHICNSEERSVAPDTCAVLDRVSEDPTVVVKEMTKWGASVGFLDVKTDFNNITGPYSVTPVGNKGFSFQGNRSDIVLPIVVQGGLFETCFHHPLPGWVKLAAETMGGYSTCINIGKNADEEILNTVFLNMNATVDEFARKVRNDPKLSNGFNAIGFSQGNTVIRGYIIRYNDPPIKNFISIDGVCAGVQGVPQCNPYTAKTTLENQSVKNKMIRTNKRQLEERNSMKEKFNAHAICMMFEEIATTISYTNFMQKNSFPANYFIDPHPEFRDAYLKYSMLAKYSNDGNHFNQTYIDNFLSVDKFMWVMSLNDTTVIPRAKEHWEAIDPYDFHKILKMNETRWFKSDSFGLRSAYQLGKFSFRNHTGSHVKIPPHQFQSLIQEMFESSKP